MAGNRQIQFAYDDDVIDAVAERCTEVDSGARNVDHILTNTLLPEMSRELLSRMAEGEPVRKIEVTMGEEGFNYSLV